EGEQAAPSAPRQPRRRWPDCFAGGALAPCRGPGRPAQASRRPAAARAHGPPHPLLRRVRRDGDPPRSCGARRPPLGPAARVELFRVGEPLNLVSGRALRFLPPLTEAQAQKLARTAWAKALLPRVPEAWRRRPFLLELLFQFVEEERPDIPPDGDLSKLLDLV